MRMAALRAGATNCTRGLQVAQELGPGRRPDEPVRIERACHVDAAAVIDRHQPVFRKPLPAQDGGEIIERRIGRQNVGDTAVVVLHRHVDRDHEPRTESPHIHVGNRRATGREHPAHRFEIRPHRQRRIRRHQGVHQLLAVLAQQDEVGARKLLRDDRLRLRAEGRDVVPAQHRRGREHLQCHHAGLQLLLDHLRHAARELEGLLAGGRDCVAVLQVLAAEIEGQERHDARDHEQQQACAQR
jgi:hypothetical protein